MYGKKNNNSNPKSGKYVKDIGEVKVNTERKLVWDGRSMTQPKLRYK
jgi:hypothetical protein